MHRRWQFVDRAAPGWLVVQLLGTAVLVVVLATAHEDTVLVWVVYAAATVAWFGFVFADFWSSRVANTALACAGLLPAFVIGVADDSTAMVIVCVVVSRFASLTGPSGGAIIVVVGGSIGVTLMSYLITGRRWTEVLGYPGLMLLVTLLGLHRRQYQLRADQAEELLRQTRAVQQEQARVAALDERARIAREMHDVLAHSLGALGIQLKVAEALLADRGDVEAALVRVRRSSRLADEGLVEARHAVAALHGDVPLLSEAVVGVVDAFRRDHQTTVDLQIGLEVPKASSAATVSLIGTLREALTNAARHAPGRPVTVRLDYTAGEIRLDVINDGAGRVPPQEQDRPRGYGLTGMRERLALVGGTLTAGWRDQGDGWQVTATVRE
jgi:signal transduction histidine kinase